MTDQPYHIWSVTVDGLSMAHGPFDPYNHPDHPEQMAECYREINPHAHVTWTLRKEGSHS